MNKSYRTVWNATTGTWAAAPETARMRTKSKSNATMKSSVTAAVAVMAGVGGVTMAADANAQAASNGNGSLTLCSPSGSRTGTAFGGSNSSGTALTPGGCGANPIFNNRQTSFMLYNNATGNGTSTGSRGSAATEVGIHGSTDGHLSLLGGSGVHIMGPADFNNNVNMTGNRINNLAAGTAGTDAVNVSQLNAAIASAATASNPYVAISTGPYAAATAARAGGSATAIGANASATGTSAVALGGNTVASNQNATAIGTLSRATGSESVAVGTSANAAGANAAAFGQAAAAQAVRTTAVGSGSTATADGATSLGYSANAVGSNAIAVGREASTSGTYGTAIGYQAKGATNAVGMGVLADASGSASVALGNRASGSGTSAVAVGSGAMASNTNSVALGAGSVTNRDNSVSVGSAGQQRQITNVAVGTQNTDAVNLGQMNAELATKVDNTYFKVNSTAAGSVVTSANSIAIGPNASATPAGAVGSNSIAIGNGAAAGGTDSIAIGTNTRHSGSGATVVGGNASAMGGGAGTALGLNSSAAGFASVALGMGTLASGRNSVALGTGSIADADNTVSVGSAAVQRRITNLAAGTGATDAVNVSQLTGVTKALGGGAAVGANGSVTDPTYNVGGTDYHNVGDALGALAASGIGNPNAVVYDDATKSTVTLGGTSAAAPVALKNVADAKDDHDALNLGQLKGAGLVGDDGSGNLTSLAVTYDGAAKDTVTLTGTNGTTLSNVKAGVADMDAVNVSQLKDSGLIDPSTGKSIAAVTYDRNADGTPNYGSVTLGHGAGPTQLKNVADAKDDHDALNLGQLKGAGLVGDDGSGNLTSLAVTYDGNAKDIVTLKGTDGTTLSNVKAGVADMDAVNVSQLKDSGLIDPSTGKSIAAVTYDRNADGTPNYGTVTLGNGAGPTQIKNVATGVDDTDAVNVKQLSTGLSDLEDRISGGNLRFIKVNADPITGTPAVASGALAVAIGAGAQGAGANSLALGSGARVSGNGSVAIGYNSVANQNNVVSVGAAGQERKIVNVADGDVAFQSTDAVNGGQLYAALNNLSTSVTSKTQQAIDTFSSEIDKKTKAAIDEVSARSMQPMDVSDPLVAIEGLQGNNLASLNGADPATTTAAAIGTSSVASGGNAVAVGLQNIAGSNNSVAIGSFAQTGAGQDYSVAVGSNVQTNGTQAVALGANAQANGDYALAVGNNGAQAIGDGSIAVGNAANVRAGSTNAIAIGTGANVARSVAGAMALGSNATAGAANSIALGADSFSNRANALSIGRAGAERQIVNVAAGTQATDAVNVSQLKGVTDSLGGGTVIGADGSITKPTYKVDGSDYHNVGDALDALASRSAGDPNAVAYDSATKDTVTLGGAGATTPVALKNVADAKDDHDALNLGQLKNAGLVGDDGAGNLTSLAVTYDAASKDSVTLGGAGAATPVALHNVADGVLSATSKDAVNGSQLFATNENLGKLKDSLEQGGAIDPTTGESLAVVYDGTAKDTVTLGGAGATTPVALKNIADGMERHDAINLGQLQDAGLVTPVDPTDPSKGLTSLAVAYDGVAKDTVTLKGADGTTLSNVKAGVADMDAVNVSQLKDAGLIDPSTGKPIAAVTYDSAAKDTVTLGGAGATTPVALKNVADAKDDGDALNLGQLKDAGLVGQDGTGNLTSLAVTYDGAAKDSVTLGGTGAAAPVALHNVADGVLSATSKDAVNGSQLFATNQNLGDLKDSLKQGGVIDPVTGESLAVVYDSASKDSVTLGNAGTPVGIHNLAAGAVNATSNDAINGSQLFTVSKSVADKIGGGAGVGADGSITDPTYSVGGQDYHSVGDALGALDKNSGNNPLAVVYDGAAKDVVTLGGAGATTPVALKNVADAKDDGDALNLGQLKNAGLVGDDGAGNLTSAAMTYDKNADGTINHDKATLAGTDGTTLSNVKAGVADMDAVNVLQLKDAGLIDPSTGKSIAAVTYDSAAKDSVTLGGAGATTPVALKNVADGTERHDAINLGQLQDAGLVGQDSSGNLTSLAVAYDSTTRDVVTLKGANGTTITNVKAGAVTATSTDAINGAQLHGTAESVAASLGGGSTVGADGKVTNPTYSLADPTDATKSKDYSNVGDALSNLDGRTTTNTTNITVINKQLADSGLVDPATGQAIAAVTYDRNADGTPNRGSVTLGGAGATAPVALKNVADGVDAHDAVNLGQLQNAGLVAPVDPTNPGAGLTSLAVTYDKHADGSANFDQITMKGANGTTITNVKAGAVSATSTDAINGAQLHGVSQSVAKSLGGGAAVDANGNVTSPSYKVSDKTFDNVGDAIENISSSLVHGSIGLVQQDDVTREITVAKDTDGTTVNFAGTAGDRVLTGVGAGAVSATSNDAINGAQLHGTAQSVADVIGGGTTVDADGKLADTSIEVNGNKYKTVAEAVQAAAQYGATDSLAVRYDLNGDGTPNYGSVTLGGSGAAPVRLTNVADGASKYDAVNFGQFSDLSSRVDGLDGRIGALELNPGTGNPGNGGAGSDYFAGTDVGTGSTTKANAGDGTGNTAAGSGAVVSTGANNATVIGSNANVSQSNGTAIGSGSKSTAEGATSIGSNANASGSKSTAIGEGANASGSNAVALGAGSVATEANTVSFGNGTDDGNRRITNIRDGINETDAATKGQLDRAVGGLQGQVNDLSRNAYSGIAAATALTMIPGVDPGKTISFGIGGATYKGYQAVAFGGEARITQNLKMKAGVGMSSGGNTVGVGASYQW
ncbi:YadA-like family protein [Burkholderia cenocepacia]|uniref:YadA-like family protein n=2 Tax=Burkholderia cenocepacia TaxID=95486 RepID=UPI001CF33A88|nr:YadA-like family protein [Burkholderia cenocepacia]MCA7921086.1 YadA-like family protein [Burkholderia cenocepacia]